MDVQTEVKVPTAYERLRADRVSRQQLETPLVRGVRLLPVFSPGRCGLHSSKQLIICCDVL